MLLPSLGSDRVWIYSGPFGMGLQYEYRIRVGKPQVHFGTGPTFWTREDVYSIVPHQQDSKCRANASLNFFMCKYHFFYATCVVLKELLSMRAIKHDKNSSTRYFVK
jgi:hypothetical protein